MSEPPSHSQSASQAFPTWSQAVALCALLLIIILFLGTVGSAPWIIYGILAGNEAAQPPLLIGILASLTGYGLVYLVAVLWGKCSVAEFFPMVPMRWSLIPPLVLAVLGAGVLGSELANLADRILPMPEWLVDVFSGLVEDPVLGIVTVVIVAPITEEFMFRGIILRGFAGNYRPAFAVLLSSLLFAVIHLNPYQFGGAFLLGCLFAWLRLQTGSLVPCLFGHALNNTIPFVLLYLVPVEIPGYSETSETYGFQPLWFDAVGVAMVVSGIAWLKAAFRRSSAPALDWPAAGE